MLHSLSIVLGLIMVYGSSNLFAREDMSGGTVLFLGGLAFITFGIWF